jgi:hypothetical protein
MANQNNRPIMRKIKAILFLLLVFISTIVMAFYFENSYRELVQHFFTFFQGDKIKFVGKNFHLLASPYLLISFDLFSVSLTLLLYVQTKTGRLLHFALAILFFFIATTATTYLDSTGYVVECTACQDGIRRLPYNEINYDFHFITSLVVGLLPSLWIYFKKKVLKKRNR